MINNQQGGLNARELAHHPNRVRKALALIQGILDVPLKFFHVIRNPWDNIATMISHAIQCPPHCPNNDPEATARETVNLYFDSMDAIIAYQSFNASDNIQWLQLYMEDMITQPAAEMNKICDFLGLPCSQRYISACQEVIMSKQSKSRHKVNWTPELIAMVDQRWSNHQKLLQRYVNDRPTG